MSEQDPKNVPASAGAPVAAAVAAQSKPVAAAKTVGAGRGFRKLPALVEDGLARGIKIFLTTEGYEVEGFYRNGTVRLAYEGADELVAIDKKDKKVPIKSFDDLVKLNYDWWKKSRDKRAEWVNPGREWQEEFSRLNLVKRQVTFVPGED